MFRACLLLSIASTLGATVVSAQPKPFLYENKGHGIRVSIPPRYKRLPVEKDRRYVLAHFLAERGNHAKGLPYLYRIAIRVMVFPIAAPKTGPKKAAAKKNHSRTAARDHGLVYTDYQDYVRRNLPGVLALEKTSPIKVGDRPGMEARVSLTDQESVYRLLAWMTDRGANRYIVEVMYMPVHAKKVEPELLAMLRSFRLEAGDPSARAATVPAPLWRNDPESWRKLDAKRRGQLRKEREKALHDRARRELLPGWTIQETEACLILSNAPERYNEAARSAAVFYRKLLDQRFGSISDEVVTRPIVRVFKEFLDYRFYRARALLTSNLIATGDEVCLQADNLGTQPGQLKDLYAGLFHHYLNEKHEHLHRHVPAWLEEGFREYSLASKPGKDGILFGPGDAEKLEVRESRRKRRRLTVKQLTHGNHKTLDAAAHELRMQRCRLVRFLIESEDGQLRDLLGRYCKAVTGAQQDYYMAPVGPGAATPDHGVAETLEKQIKKSRKKLREAVNKSVLRWPARRWRTVEKAYDRFNRGL